MSKNYFDCMQPFMNSENFTKTLKGLPGLDWHALTDIIKNNTETMNEANKVATESMQSMVKRGAELMHHNFTELCNSTQNIATYQGSEQIADHQQQYLKTNLENHLEGTKEILDIAAKSAMEVVEVMGRGMGENINKVTAKPKKPL